MAISVESALIGSLLIDPEKIVAISDKVRAEDFADMKAKQAFTAIMQQWRTKKPVDVVSVSMQTNGIASFLAQSTTEAFPASVVEFATNIATQAKGRRISAGLQEILKKSPETMLSQMMDIYRREIGLKGKRSDISAVLDRVNNIISANRKQGKIGFATGFNIHEERYIRYIPGHIWCMGGFTSAGKTAMMVQKICNLIALGENPSILIVSTEMTEEQIVARIIANFTGVHSMRVLTGNFHSAEEEDAVVEAKNAIKMANLAIYDNINELSDIETAFHKADLQGGVNIGFIDYVQNCRCSTANSEYQEQQELAKRIQQLAKDTRSTITCLSQVSNDVGRGNTEQLEYKGAGEWAAVADVGVMLQRHKTDKYRLKYLIKKNRHGALGECQFEFKNDYTRLEEKEGEK